MHATTALTALQTAHRTAPMDRTAEQWEALAQGEREARADSWERSDSDGYLTQWAAQKMEHRYLDAAKAARAGWAVEVTALFDLEGNVLTTSLNDGDYGSYWYVPQFEGKARYVRESHARSYVTARRNNEKKGVRLGLVKVAAYFDDRTALVEWDREDLSAVRGTVTADLYADRIAAGITSEDEHYLPENRHHA